MQSAGLLFAGLWAKAQGRFQAEAQDGFRAAAGRVAAAGAHLLPGSSCLLDLLENPCSHHSADSAGSTFARTGEPGLAQNDCEFCRSVPRLSKLCSVRWIDRWWILPVAPSRLPAWAPAVSWALPPPPPAQASPAARCTSALFNLFHLVSAQSLTGREILAAFADVMLSIPPGLAAC